MHLSALFWLILLLTSQRSLSNSNFHSSFQILRDLGVRTMKLMTNNPAKYSGLKGYGLAIAGRVPLLTPITKENKRYLATKRAKMGHVYGLDFNGSLNSLIIGGNGNTTPVDAASDS